MDRATGFTHALKNREIGYYGEVPYSYGGVIHEARPISSNPYLNEMFEKVQKDFPALKINSALVTRYGRAGSHLPAHSDDESSIVPASSIITVSLGQTRKLRFKHRRDRSDVTTLELRHGDIFVMSRDSQEFFTHEVLPSEDPRKEPEIRISITFRNLRVPEEGSISIEKEGPGPSHNRGLPGCQSPRKGLMNKDEQSTRTQTVVGHHAKTTSDSLIVGDGRRPSYVNMTTSAQHTPEIESPEPRPKSSRTFVTALITDSIMKRIPEDALGTNHTLYVINRSKVDALADRRMKDKLQNLNPDFIYVHLGINNLINGEKNPDVLFSELKRFEAFVINNIPGARLIFSIPLPTDRPEECSLVKELQRRTVEYVDHVEGRVKFLNRKTLINKNSNFWDTDGNQRAQLFGRDGIHLSRQGLEVSMQNLRKCIHEISRRINEVSKTWRNFN